MTLIVGVACPSGLVLAGDRRVCKQTPNGIEVVTDASRKVGLIGSRYIYGTAGQAHLDWGLTYEKIELLNHWAPRPGRKTQRGGSGLSTGTRGVKAAATRAQVELQRLLLDDLFRAGAGAPRGLAMEVLLGGFNQSGAGRFFQVHIDADTDPDEDRPEPRGSTRDPRLVWLGDWLVPSRLFRFPAIAGVVSWITTRAGPLLARPLPLETLTLDEACLLAGALVQEAIDLEECPGVGGGVDVVIATMEGVRVAPPRDKYPHLQDLPFLPPPCTVQRQSEGGSPVPLENPPSPVPPPATS